MNHLVSARPSRRSFCWTLIVTFALAGCSLSFPPSAPAIPSKRPAPITEYGFLSTLADTPGAKVVTINGFGLDDRHVAAWQPGNVPGNRNREAGIWLPPGRHVVEVEYIRNIDAGISLSRGQVPFTLTAGRTYIVRPQVTSDYARVSFAVVDHGHDFPAHCLPWSILQTRSRDTQGQRPGVTGADILNCRRSRPL